MKTLPHIIAITLLALSTASARIGETPEQIEARYGKPIDIERTDSRLETRRYFSGDLKISVSFLDGISAMEYFAKANQNHDFTASEIELLLTANSGGGHWQRDQEDDRFTEVWRITDRPVARIAHHQRLERFLIIFTPQHVEVSEAARRKAEADKLGKF